MPLAAIEDFDMRVWHVGAAASPQRVCGVNNAVWLLASEQALLGHQVVLIGGDSEDPVAQSVAERTGLQLKVVPAKPLHYDFGVLEVLLEAEPPDIVHMHSVFIPRQVTLARALVRRNIPYAIAPHGGLSPYVLRRGWLKKWIYSMLAERARFLGAAAIAALTPGESREIERFVPQYQGIIRQIFNPMSVAALERQEWQGYQHPARFVFLGRFDVFHKGLDLLVAVARCLKSVEFHLYGAEDFRTRTWLRRLRKSLPPNVWFHDPVFGADKTQVLIDATLYIQFSRWEGFPLSIAEALYLGVPCAIASPLNIAEIFHQSDLGLILPHQPQAAANALAKILTQPERLQTWSVKGRAFARESFSPSTIASAYLKLYEDALNP